MRATGLNIVFQFVKKEFTIGVHAGIDQGWGYAGVAAIRDNLAVNNHVVLVDNGDAIQGETIGTMTDGKISSELYSWNNAIAPADLFGLTGTVVDAVEWGARNNPGENGGCLQGSGLTYEIRT